MSVGRPIVLRLCISHFLSTWNTRSFEFSAILFLASIYTGSLLGPSIYALVRAISAIGLSPAVGRYIDTHDRLKVIRRSIILQRFAVVVSCLLFIAKINSSAHDKYGLSIDITFMSALSIFACLEKLTSIMNMVSVERDWVVVIAGSSTDDLRYLNSLMRRIDLLCKMMGPLVISILAGIALLGSIYFLLVWNLISTIVEYYSIKRIYDIIPELASRARSPEATEPEESQTEDLNDDNDMVLPDPPRSRHSFMIYLHHPCFLPSFSISILYFTVLSFGGQFVAYLISVGYSSSSVGILRTGSVLFELSATWIAPFLMKKLGHVRSGLWFINWQSICCILAAFAVQNRAVLENGEKFLYFFTSKSTAFLVIAVIFSRIGLWGFDLCSQIIIQEGVEPEIRSAFSSVESSFQNFFELLSFVSTIAFSHPSMFKYPVMLSAMAVTAAASCYSLYVLKVRKHIFHSPFDACKRRVIHERSEHLLNESDRSTDV
ncbi:Ferroporti-1 [Dipodascopsis uninucleata]